MKSKHLTHASKILIGSEGEITMLQWMKHTDKTKVLIRNGYSFFSWKIQVCIMIMGSTSTFRFLAVSGTTIAPNSICGLANRRRHTSRALKSKKTRIESCVWWESDSDVFKSKVAQSTLIFSSSHIAQTQIFVFHKCVLVCNKILFSFNDVTPGF